MSNNLNLTNLNNLNTLNNSNNSKLISNCGCTTSMSNNDQSQNWHAFSFFFVFFLLFCNFVWEWFFCFFLLIPVCWLGCCDFLMWYVLFCFSISVVFFPFLFSFFFLLLYCLLFFYFVFFIAHVHYLVFNVLLFFILFCMFIFAWLHKYFDVRLVIHKDLLHLHFILDMQLIHVVGPKLLEFLYC